MERVSQVLREYRAKEKLTQEQFADLLKISRVTYNHYENGSRTPDCYVLKNICRVTGLSADYILGISATKNVRQSDIAKTTGLSEKAIEFLQLTKENGSFLNSLVNLIISEENLPEFCCRQGGFPGTALQGEMEKADKEKHILDEIKAHWEINDIRCPVREDEPANTTPPDYVKLDEMGGKTDKVTAKENSLLADEGRVQETTAAKTKRQDSASLLDSIGRYIQFENGCIGLKGQSGTEKLNRNHCLTLFIGGKYVEFPSEESDKIVEQLLIKNVIDSLKTLKRKYRGF